MQISAGRHGLCCVIFRNNLTTIHKTGKIQSLGLHFDSFTGTEYQKNSLRNGIETLWKAYFTTWFYS